MVSTEPDVIVSTSSGNTSSQTAIKDSSSSYRILIVDDEQDVALGYESILKGAGFNADIYNDPLIALSKLKEITLLLHFLIDYHHHKHQHHHQQNKIQSSHMTYYF